jgi:hypothetical protein
MACGHRFRLTGIVQPGLRRIKFELKHKIRSIAAVAFFFFTGRNKKQDQEDRENKAYH